MTPRHTDDTRAAQHAPTDTTPLTHADMIVLARLLGNHLTNPNGSDFLEGVGQRLLEYAVNTGEFDPLSGQGLDPLPLVSCDHELYRDRVCFYTSK